MLEDSFKLHEDEKVIKYVRRHWVFLIIDLLKTAVLFIIPILIIWTLQFFGWMPQFEIFGVTFSALVSILIYMWGIFCWLLIAEKFTDYALDFWVITNKRIVESELVKLFDRQLSILELQDIEDITIRNKGFWANYFGYGTLEVQTAGARNEFLADKIFHPEKIQQIMFNAKLKDEEEKKNIEKTEIEQISQRVIKEEVLPENLNKYIPKDQNIDTADFDWAHINQKQKEDIRNLQEQIEEIESKYKKGIDQALRSE